LVYILRTLLPYIEFDSRIEFAERVVFNGISLPDPRAPLNIFADSRSDILMAYSEDDGNVKKFIQFLEKIFWYIQLSCFSSRI